MNSLSNEINFDENSNIECAICFSHLRWDFVFQRPQHLISRLSSTMATIFWEEPIFGETNPHLELTQISPGLTVARPHLPAGTNPAETAAAQKRLLDSLLAGRAWRPVVAWYYTPMALAFSQHLATEVTVYDCMDELSAFNRLRKKAA